MTKLVLHTSPSVFPNPQRVRLMMHEKGIADAVEERILKMAPVGEQRGWRHLKRNPWGETPTLELPDGGTLAESAAIARYLDASFPGRKIMGETPLEVGQDTMWDDRIWVQILYRITTMFHVLHQGLGPKLELTHNRNGASIAARRRWPTPPSSTATLPTAATGCSAAPTPPSPTSRCAPPLPSRSTRSARPRSTNASSSSTGTGRPGRRGRHSRARMRTGVGLEELKAE